MAVLKFISTIHPRVSVGKSGTYLPMRELLKYILNPDKTEQGTYIGSIHCEASPEGAMQAMLLTKRFYGKISSSKSDRLAYHWTMSWSPEEKISEEEALSITKEFCERYFQDEFEVVYSVHNDKDHMHAHICFNSVNLVTGKKFRYENGDWANSVQPLVDEINQAKGFHTLEMDTGMSLKEYYRKHMYQKKKQKDSDTNRNNHKYHNEKTSEYPVKYYIQKDIDEIIIEVENYEEFLEKLKQRGYSIRQGNSVKHGEYLALHPEGVAGKWRTYTLGDEYTVHTIQKRIEEKRDLDREKENFVVPFAPEREYIFQYRLENMKQLRPVKEYQILYYHRMYLLGTKPKGQYINYYLVRDSLREIQKLQKEMDLIDQRRIMGADDTYRLEDLLAKKLDSLNRERIKAYCKRKPYKEAIKILEKIEEFENYHMEDVTLTREEADQYYTLIEKMESFGYTREEIQRAASDCQETLRQIRIEKADLKREKEMLQSIRNRYLGETTQRVQTYQMDQLDSGIKAEVQLLQKTLSEGCEIITISKQNFKEETATAVKTLIPGSKGQAFIWIQKSDMKVIHNGKSICTFLDLTKTYEIDTQNGIRHISGEELYNKHYNHYQQIEQYGYTRKKVEPLGVKK